MFLQRITDYVLRSRYHAMMAAFLCDAPVIFSAPANSLLYSFVVLVLSTFGIAIVGLVTLRRGAVEGFYVLVAAILPYVLGYLFYPGDYAEQLAVVSALLVQFSNVLTWLTAYLLYRTASWSVVIELLSVICVLGIVIVHALVPDLQAWWAINLKSNMQSALQSTGMSGDSLIAGGLDLKSTLTLIASFATRFAVGFVWVNTILQLMISRWWQEKIFNPGGLHIELHHVRLSKIAGVLFVIGFALSFWQPQALADSMAIFYLLFGFAGLSLLHCFAASLKSGGKLVLFVAYTLLPLSMIVIPMMGLLDVWMNFRKYFRVVSNKEYRLTH